jgi:hypothetical protein
MGYTGVFPKVINIEIHFQKLVSVVRCRKRGRGLSAGPSTFSGAHLRSPEGTLGTA